jgi:hypothetical protein
MPPHLTSQDESADTTCRLNTIMYFIVLESQAGGSHK